MILLILLILGFIVIGVPIAFALALTAIVLLLLEGMPLSSLPLALFNGPNNTILLAVPFFVLAGEIMGQSGISARLVNFVNSIVGVIRGGLAIANVVASMIFAEISGASVADAVGLGKIFIPQMVNKGYPKLFSAAVTSSSACLGIIIPPSIPMILMGAEVGIPISGLFAAGFLPGMLIGVFQSVVAYYMVRRRNYPVESEAFSIRGILVATLNAIPVLLFPLIILGGIISGVFTPTEASAVAVFYATILGLAYRDLNLKKLYTILLTTVKQTAIIMLIVASSYPLGTYFAREHIAQNITSYILGFSGHPTIVLLLITFLMFILGMFFQAAPIIIIVMPLIMPTVNNVGINPFLFGVICTIMLSVGQQTPPVATVSTAIASISNLNILSIFWESKYFLLPMIFVAILAILFPPLVLWFPSLVLR
jgi:tripartite ATP-independent transporter DctM subunit